MDCSVIIATRNRRQALVRCLDHLARQDVGRDRFEVVVVDDASTDGTADVLSDGRNDLVVRSVGCRDRRGPGGARNRGLAIARGEIAVFVDDDTVAPAWFLGEHVRTHRRHGPLVVDGPAITIYAPRDGFNPPFRRPDVRAMAGLDLFGRAFATVNASARVEDVKRCGGFDERLLAWEDVDLGRRLRRMGLERRRNRRAFVLHCKTAATLEDQRRLAEERGRFAGTYYLKYGDRAARWQARLRYLRYDAVLTTCRLVGAATGETDGPAHRQVAAFELIHAYANGLKAGLHPERTAGRSQ